MSRAIDGDALRDRLQNLADDEWNRSTPTSWAEAFTECADMVEDQPTIEPEPHWIPCSERYPEQDERVLVTIGNYDYFVWDCMSNRGDDYFWEDEHGFYHNKYEVLAWMPLPEPYAERGTDEKENI